MRYLILLSSESGVISYGTCWRGPATLREFNCHMWLGYGCWTAPVWLARDSVSLICINLHERCLIIFLPCIHVSGASGLYLSHCLYAFWVCFLSVFIQPRQSYLLPTQEKKS